MDRLYSLGKRIYQVRSFQDDDHKGTKNVYSYRTNQSEKATETSKVMCVTTGRNEGISLLGNNLASSSTGVNLSHNLSKKNVHSGCCPSLSLNKETPVGDNRDQRTKVNDLPNSRQDSNLNTIKNWLQRLGKPTILPTLENSLEQVKRNKISPESHREMSKSIDKELQQLSRTFHPDRAGDTEWQAALNALRVVLKTLTEVFLENIFIDYKYEYFSRLDVRVLVNENERNNTIQTIFYKICVFSETKRMNIIGEIRKFLIESEKCVKSFFNDNESDFLTFRKYALYHLRKSIEGYQKLEKQCTLLIEECSSKDDNMTGLVQNMVDESLKEWSILRKLEQSATRSFQGNFEIFPVHKDMDEYYILPFVDYVNVLSMCNLLLQTPKSSIFTSLSRVGTFNTDDCRNHFPKAYHLAYGIYVYNISNKKARGNLDIYEYSQELRKTLETIFMKVLQTDYTVDVYREGKSNRAEMYEKLLSVKSHLKDLEEKEKTLDGHVRQYQMERNKFPESVLNYRQDEGKSCKINMTNGEKESEEGSRKLTSPLEGGKNQCTMETKKFNESVLNCLQDEDESLEVDMINGEKQNEDSKKLTSTLEGEQKQNKMETKCYESVLNCRQDEDENLTVNMPMRENKRERYSSNPNSLSIGEKIPEES